MSRPFIFSGREIFTVLFLLLDVDVEHSWFS